MFDFAPPPVTTDPTAKVLRDAAAYIEKYGWADDSNNAHHGAPACALNAIYRTISRDLDGARLALGKYLGLPTSHAGQLFGEIGDWNDASDKETVLAAMRGAADMVERGHG
ncbi:MAG: DUF6197 family protein [Pseudomonadales bacterium]